MQRLKELDVTYVYYPAIMLVYAATLISLDLIHPGMVSAWLLLLVTAALALGGRFACLKEKRTMDIIMAEWLIYNVLSGIWTVSFGIPFGVYAGELFTTALPMIFYFSGRSAASEDKERFYKFFVYAVTFIGLLGLLLYITAPEFYIKYLFRLGYISKADVSTMRVRMFSVIGSTLTGYLSVAAMLGSAYFIIQSNGKKFKLLFFIDCFLAFMSNQRASMVVALIVLLYMNYLIFFTFKMLPMKLFKIEAGIFAAGFVGLLVVFHGAFMKVYYRLVSLPGAIGQRSDQWVGAANNMANKWLGNGLGANGHRANGFTEHMIADGGIAKLYCEMGIIGTALFVFLMLLALKKGFKNLHECAPEIGLIVITLLTAIGSNVMSFALSVPIFYYAIGSIAGEAAKAEGSK